MFQAKGCNHGGQRLQSQRYCDQISNMIQHFLPGKVGRRLDDKTLMYFVTKRYLFSGFDGQ